MRLPWSPEKVEPQDPTPPVAGYPSITHAVPNLAGETFREFYTRKYAAEWPTKGMALSGGYGGAIGLLSRINEASADWMDALAKKLASECASSARADAAIMSHWEKETTLLRAAIEAKTAPVAAVKPAERAEGRQATPETQINLLREALTRAALRFAMLAGGGVGFVNGADPGTGAKDAWDTLRACGFGPESPQDQNNDLAHRFDRA